MKFEYSPVLPPGLHDMTLDNFKAEFVDKFPLSVRRKEVFARFSDFLSILLATGFILEIWLDGSFVTRKDEPDDIDAVAFFDRIKANTIVGGIYSAVDITDITFIQTQYYTDIRYAPSDDVNSRSYWRGWYGFSRLETPKGFVRLII